MGNRCTHGHGNTTVRAGRKNYPLTPPLKIDKIRTWVRDSLLMKVVYGFREYTVGVWKTKESG